MSSISRRSVVVGGASLAFAGCKLKPKTQRPNLGRAPEFSLTAHTGEQVQLSKMLASGPAMVVFYRGRW